MILKKIGGKNFIVNLLSDFIINKIGKDTSTVIVVVDVNNFMVVKGKTNSNDVINLSETVSEFSTTYESFLGNKKITNTIDLIEYSCDINEVKKITSTFFNTENCSYSNKQILNNSKENNEFDFDVLGNNISNEFVSVSEFPHGYSLNQGRSIFYYSKKIFYSIPSTYPVTSITLTIDKNNTGEEIIEVFDEFHQENDNTLKSSILDHFNFNFSKLDEEMKKVDWSFELTNPLEDFEKLKNVKKMEII